MSAKTTLDGIRFRDILLLHALILLHSSVGIIAKTLSSYRFLSTPFLLLYALEVIILVIYAFFWQKVLKRFELSVAYANNGMYIVWTLVWAALFFGEHIRLNNIIGALVVISGIVVLFWKK